MTDSIDLTTLRVIAAAADLGSISAASDRLNLAVAAASVRISALEDHLGFRVFERSSRGVQLTPGGHLLVQRSRELLADADRLALDLRDYSQGFQGYVRILANSSAILEALPGKLEHVMRSHPLIRVDVEERSSPDIPMAVLDGRADLGIVDIANPPQGLVLQDLFTDTLVLVVPAAHPLAHRDRIALIDAMDQDFIALTDGTALSNRVMLAARQAGRTVRIRMQMRGFDAVCRMVAAGLGVGVLPLEAVGPQLTCLPITAVPLSDPWAIRTHRLITRSAPPPSPAARTVITTLMAD